MSTLRERSLADCRVQVIIAFEGSDASQTRSLYDDLETIVPQGILAANLLRAQKASSRAKVYRGGGYRSVAYDRKQWAIGQVAMILKAHPELGIEWGWKPDPTSYVPWVFYVELPTGQVSFHTHQRGEGPDFGKEWDGVKNVSPSRIISFAALVLARQAPGQPQVVNSEPTTGDPRQLALAL